MGEKEVSLALAGMSSGDYVSQDSINLSTSSLFKGRGDLPSRRCLAEWLVKIRICFLLLPRLLPAVSVYPSFSPPLFLHFPPSSIPFPSSFVLPFPCRFLPLSLSLSHSPTLRHPRLSHDCNGFLFSVYSRRRRFSPLASSKHPGSRRCRLRRCIHSKLADLDRRSEVNPPIFDRAPGTGCYPLFMPEPDDPV